MASAGSPFVSGGHFGRHGPVLKEAPNPAGFIAKAFLVLIITCCPTSTTVPSKPLRGNPLTPRYRLNSQILASPNRKTNQTSIPCARHQLHRIQSFLKMEVTRYKIVDGRKRAVPGLPGD